MSEHESRCSVLLGNSYLILATADNYEIVKPTRWMRRTRVLVFKDGSVS